VLDPLKGLHISSSVLPFSHNALGVVTTVVVGVAVATGAASEVEMLALLFVRTIVGSGVQDIAAIDKKNNKIKFVFM
jgi:hypothetical protein